MLAFWGVLSGLWPAIGGISGQYAGAAESSSVYKPTGVVTAPWDTESAPSQSWIKVHVTSNIPVQVLVVALNTRTIRVSNASGYASADDYLAVANGKAEGTDVWIYSGHGGPVVYRIYVHIADSAKVGTQVNFTDAQVEYNLSWEIQKMDPMVIVGGLVLFNMFFVTEYILHLRRDIRAVSKRLDRGAGDFARAPSAALGAPLTTAADEAPPKERGGFFGRRGREPQPSAPAAPSLEAAPLYPSAPPMAAPAPPAPSATAPPTRYGAATAPDSYAPPPYAPPAYGQPQSYAPPPYAPSAPQAEPAPPSAYEVMAPPPAPPAPPAPSSAARGAARVAPPLPPSPAAAMAPPAPAGTEPVSKVRCPQCKHIVPVYTAERPTPIKCPNCGKRGMLTK